MPRAFLIVMDSVGVGGAPDAALYSDAGADTLGHIAEACARGDADRPSLRAGPLRLPFMASLGLRQAAEAARGAALPDLGHLGEPRGAFGCAAETSRGKDTPSGHWELAGCPLAEAPATFPNRVPALPPGFTAALISEADLSGLLGDRHANGVAIVDELGAEHVRTGRPIVYTSVDSVVQIAAHEDPAVFGLARLLDVCRIARRLADPLRVGRVIARPFVGDEAGGFTRTGNRRDFSVEPPADTILDRCAQGRRAVVSLGKIGDIFAHRSTGQEIKAVGNEALFDRLLPAVDGLADGGLLFANFVDFDTEHGHRRDVAGYAACLEAFDRRLPALAERLRPGDLSILTADHGNDPTWRGTDHTREQAPLLAFGPGVATGFIGRRGFSDVAASIARHLRLPPVGPGTSWL